MRTTSYACALTRSGSVSRYSRSSGYGIVNGWCIATYLPSSSEYSNSGKSITNISLKSSFFLRSSIVPRSFLKAPSTFLTVASLSAQNRIKSPGFAATLSRSSFITSSEKYFVKIVYSCASGRTAIHAIPFAPYETALSVSSSIWERVKSLFPFTLIARTTPPERVTDLNTEKSLFAAMSVTSVISRPNLRSGLSQPYLSIHSRHVKRGKSYLISTPSAFLKMYLNIFSR